MNTGSLSGTILTRRIDHLSQRCSLRFHFQARALVEHPLISSPPGPSAGTSIFGPLHSKGPQPKARAPGFHPLFHPRSPPSHLPETELPLQTLASGPVLSRHMEKPKCILRCWSPCSKPLPSLNMLLCKGWLCLHATVRKHRRSLPSSQCHSLHSSACMVTLDAWRAGFMRQNHSPARQGWV